MSGGVKTIEEQLAVYRQQREVFERWEAKQKAKTRGALAGLGGALVEEIIATPQPASEVRVTDPETGGQKGQKLAQLGALDPKAIMEVAQVAGHGATKYERYNFLKTYDWSLSYDALQRHVHAFWGGEDNDPESGLPHMAHAAFHCLALLSFMRIGRAKDDRPPVQEAA